MYRPYRSTSNSFEYIYTAIPLQMPLQTHHKPTLDKYAFEEEEKNAYSEIPDTKGSKDDFAISSCPMIWSKINKISSFQWGVLEYLDKMEDGALSQKLTLTWKSYKANTPQYQIDKTEYKGKIQQQCASTHICIHAHRYIETETETHRYIEM